MTATSNPRIMRGLTIVAQANQVQKVDSHTFKVKSQSGNGCYIVAKQGADWVCTCPDFQYRGVECKHIHSCRLNLTLVDAKEIYETYKEIEENKLCKYCASDLIVRNGLRYTKKGRKQTYKCLACSRRFSERNGFAKMKYTPETITMALDLYFKGLSLRKVVDFVEQNFAMKPDHATVLRWVQKYVGLIDAYVEDLKPELSEMWHVDEMMIKTGGKWSWLWNVMDRDTRFLLTSLISEKREVEDARRVFQNAKEIARGKPSTVVTDGLKAYEKAFRKEFFTLRKPRIEHIRNVAIRDNPNNNLIERLHGTIRERDKVMRGMKGKESAQILVDGLRNYYNYLRPHMNLGKTPAEASEIDLELGRNRWKSIIRKSNNQRKR